MLHGEIDASIRRLSALPEHDSLELVEQIRTVVGVSVDAGGPFRLRRRSVRPQEGVELRNGREAAPSLVALVNRAEKINRRPRRALDANASLGHSVRRTSHTEILRCGSSNALRIGGFRNDPERGFPNGGGPQAFAPDVAGSECSLAYVATRTVLFRMSLLRRLLSTTALLPTWRTAWDVPPSATNKASVATTFAYDRRLPRRPITGR
jgi:hypothetical protein